MTAKRTQTSNPLAQLVKMKSWVVEHPSNKNSTRPFMQHYGHQGCEHKYTLYLGIIAGVDKEFVGWGSTENSALNNLCDKIRSCWGDYTPQPAIQKG
jgi:hypothetical protein